MIDDSPIAGMGLGDTLAPGEDLDLSESFFPDEDAGVDLAEDGLRGSFLIPDDPSIPFSRGDLFPLVWPSLESSTTRSCSIRRTRLQPENGLSPK